MSKVSQFSYENVTPSEHPVTPVVLGLTTEYTKDVATADICILENLTTPTDAAERIMYRSKLIPQVNHNLNIQYPGPVKKGVTYTIEVQETLTTTDTDHPEYRVDDPIVMYLTVRHSRSGVIDEAKIAEVFKRLCSAVYKQDGTTRFGDLMRGSETPVVD